MQLGEHWANNLPFFYDDKPWLSKKKKSPPKTNHGSTINI